MKNYTTEEIKMSFDKTGLADYRKADSAQIIENILYEAQSFREINGKRLTNVKPGIKKSEDILDVQPGVTTLQAGHVSDISANGTTKIPSVAVEVKPVALREDYSPYQLIGKVPEMLLDAGSNPSDDALLDIVMKLKGSEVNQAVELALWQGNATLGVVGFAPEAAASSDVIASGSAPVAFTNNTAIGIVEGLVSKMQEELPNHQHVAMNMYMSPSNYAVWFRQVFGLNKEVDANTVGYEEGMPQSAMIPGTNITAVAMMGLVGDNTVILTRPENLITGTDLENDFFEMKYIDGSYKYQLAMEFKLGTKIARLNEVVITKA